MGTPQKTVKTPAKPKPRFGQLNLGHFSMQFSDTEAQKKHDATVIFRRGYDAITGTESGEQDTRRQLRFAARANGYVFHVNRSNWVAIKKSLILPDTYFKGHQAFVDNEKTFGPGHDLHVTWAGCRMKGFGKVTFLASHYATYGSPIRDVKHRVNVQWNRQLAKGIGDLAEKFGAGNALVFYGGDQNIVDRNTDTFLGQADLTSAWDELGKWEDTGHGNIDVIASYDKDGRVEALYIRALDDKELRMFMDHFPVEAGFKVRLLP